MVKNDQMVKITVFAIFFFLQKWYFAESWGVFALHSVHQNPFFELSKSTIRQFFTLRRKAFDLGGVKLYLHDFLDATV